MIATFDTGRIASLRAELDRLVESGEGAGFSGLSYAELGNLLDDARFAAKAAAFLREHGSLLQKALDSDASDTFEDEWGRAEESLESLLSEASR